MIREATKTDLPQLIEFARSFSEEKRFELPFDTNSAEVQIRNLLLIKNAKLFVSLKNDIIVGVVGGPIVNWPYDLNTPVAQEYLVYGEDIQMLRNEFYLWAMKNGAKAVVRLCIDPTPGNRVIYLKGGL